MLPFRLRIPSTAMCAGGKYGGRDVRWIKNPNWSIGSLCKCCGPTEHQLDLMPNASDIGLQLIQLIVYNGRAFLPSQCMRLRRIREIVLACPKAGPSGCPAVESHVQSSTHAPRHVQHLLFPASSQPFDSLVFVGNKSLI